MTDTLNNPTHNFTVPETQPAGMRIPEFAMRQLISWALGQIRTTIGTPNDVVDLLLAVVPKEARDEYKQWLMNNQNIYTDVSWPRTPVSLALVVVEPQGEQEDTSNAFIGDSVGTTYSEGPNGQPYEAPAYGIPERRTTNIYIGTDDDRTTLFLYETIKFILVTNKQNLTKLYDVHNLSLSGGVLAQDDEKLPQFAYYRVLICSYMTLFDFNGPASGPAVVDLSLFIDTVENGGRVVVNVPGPED